MSELTDLLPRAESESGSLVDAIHRTLREAILAGSLPPGFRLREIALATHFDCSTTPVREAIRRLVSEGLAKLYPRRGAVVTSLTTAEVDHLYETRLVLETYATRKGAERRPSDGDLAPVRDVLHRQQALAPGTTHGASLDAEFHQVLTALAGNPVIADLVLRCTRQIEAVQSRYAASVDDGLEHAIRAHEAIYEAVRAGDADAAEQLMREHLEWNRDAVAESVRRGRR